MHTAGRLCPACGLARRQAWVAVGGLSALTLAFLQALVLWRQADQLFFLAGVVLSLSPILTALGTLSRKGAPAKKMVFLSGAAVTAIPWALLAWLMTENLHQSWTLREPLHLPFQNLSLFKELVLPPLLWSGAISVTTLRIITWKKAKQEEKRR